METLRIQMHLSYSTESKARGTGYYTSYLSEE